jgi:hypothetical protein
LEILEETNTAIKFGYSAFTNSKEDTTVVRLFAEEISTNPDEEPYIGVISYLEETPNGEFIWEIPEEFKHNGKYRFYISGASSNAGKVTQSNSVEVFIAKLEADLECTWELAYNGDNTNSLTAYITVTNTGIKDTTFQWEILDYTNNDSIEEDNNYFGNTSNIAEILASGSGLEIKGNSSISFQQVITVTDELKDNPSSLLLSVTQESTNSNLPDSSQEDKPHADDTDEILFTAIK